jgi:hypothetical protein
MTVIASVFGLLAAAFWLGALLFAARTRAFIRQSVARDGKVIGAYPRAGSDGTVYSAVVEFFEGPSRFEIRADYGRNKGAIHIGERARVRFLPNQPDKAKIDSVLGLYGGTIVLGAFGALTTVVTAVCAYASYRL